MQMGWQGLPSPTQTCLPHSRHFIPSFMLNFAALSVQLGTYPVIAVTFLIRLQELSGWLCGVVLCGRCGCPRTKAPVCCFL